MNKLVTFILSKVKTILLILIIAFLLGQLGGFIWKQILNMLLGGK